MAKDPIIFAMANPVPEIMPDEARAAGAAVVGTGRSDFANQINNCLAFPGIFRGALDVRAPRITMEMKVAAARALAGPGRDARSRAGHPVGAGQGRRARHREGRRGGMDRRVEPLRGGVEVGCGGSRLAPLSASLRCGSFALLRQDLG